MMVNTKNELTLTKKFVVTSADTDMFGRLKTGSLVNYLLQSAISSADELGFGLKYLKDENLFWVLSRIEVQINKVLKWYDEITVETWPKTVNGIFYIRDFFVKKGNDICAKATSAWLAVDVAKKRPKIIDGFISEKFYALKHKFAIEQIPEKIQNQDSVPVSSIETTYFDIDLNKHVTTTRYIDWMMDTFSVDFHKINYPCDIKLNIIKETMPNEKMDIFRNDNTENVYFEGFNKTSEKTSFRGIIKFCQLEN